MLRTIITFTLLFTICDLAACPAPEPFTAEELSRREQYIKRFYKIAMREMERSGVPASIKLAQAIRESGYGTGELAKNANNHFGMKCGSGWKGDTYYKKDDDKDENGRLIKSCFRGYLNPDASFVAHSEFLRDPVKASRYGRLFRLRPDDYEGWARGLQLAGYATDTTYATNLIRIIRENNLARFDAMVLNGDPFDDDRFDEDPFGNNPVADNNRPGRNERPNRDDRPGRNDRDEQPNRDERPGRNVGTAVDAAITGILTRNDVNYFISQKPVSVAEVAKKVDLDVEKLLRYNEELNGGTQTVAAGERVFLQKKRRAYRGRKSTYEVQAGEDLYDVAQKFGLRLKNLARRNHLEQDADPATGETVKLRGRKLKDPPRLEGEVDPNAPPPNVPTRPDGTIDLDTDPNNTTGRTDTPSGPGVVRPNPGAVVVPRPTLPTVQPNPVEAPPRIIPPNVRPATGPDAATPQYHSVEGGETLYAISRRYGLTVDALKRLNGLTSTSIVVGQQLRVR